jgi:dihydrofolate reductase
VTGEVTKSGDVQMEGETRKVLAVNPTKLEVGGKSYAVSADVVKAKTKENRDLVTGENVAIVGGGALAGTLLGKLLLDNAALGAILGAAGGSAVAVARSDTDIELEQGTVLTLELDRAVKPTAST